EELMDMIGAAYERLPVGDPLDSRTLVGPLIRERAHHDMQAAIAEALVAGGGGPPGGGRLAPRGAARGFLPAACPRRDAGPARRRVQGDLRAGPLRPDLHEPARGDRAE